MANSNTSDQQTKATTGEQSEDQAGVAKSGVEEGTEETTEETEEEETEEEGDDSDDEDDDSEGVISDAEFNRLKDDPVALRKALNRGFTQKSQQLAPYRKLITALEKSPKETIEALAGQFGIQVVKPKSATEEAVDDLSTRVLKAVKKNLGETYDDLAGPLAQAIHEAAEMVVGDRLKGTESRVEEVVADAALNEANATIAAFEEKYPEWSKHEKAMVALSQRMPPGEGMSQYEYLENLYFLVTREGAQGDAVKKVVKRMSKSAANTDKGGSTVDTKVVALSPGQKPTFAQAAAAARRGERFE